MKLFRFAAFALLIILLLTWVPLRPTVYASAPDNTTGPWFRYQGEPDSYDKYNNQNLNCGPTSVAMAVQYSKGLYIPINRIRSYIGKNKSYTNEYDIMKALTHWNVQYSTAIYNAQSIENALSHDHIVIVAVNMKRIAPGADINGASTDPSLRYGRFASFTGYHWLVVKGISADGKYFQVYDGNVWSGPADATYWYSDGTPKGRDRYYAVDQLERGMLDFGRDGSKGVEITDGRHGSVISERTVTAQVTYYTASKTETGKAPGDPGWGIMANGKMVHWGAVAVDPRYIPLGTRMKIEGWGDKIFVAEDTGSLVKGWHVDVFWPGTHQQALGEASKTGGERRITLLDSGSQLPSQSAAEPPVAPNVSVAGGRISRSQHITLNLDPGEENITGVMLSNNPYFTEGFEQPFSTAIPWKLPEGDGRKTVYLRFKNSAGEWGVTEQVSVILKGQTPQGSLVISPDPRVISAVSFQGNSVPTLGASPSVTGSPRYAALDNNLLANSGFERWAGGIPAGWDSAANARAWQYYSPVIDSYGGQHAMRSDTDDQKLALTQSVSMAPNALYTLSVWAKGGSGSLEIDERRTLDAPSKTHMLSVAPQAAWHQVRVSFRTRPDTSSADVRLLGVNATWDDVQLTEGAQPPTYRGDGLLLEPSTTNLITNPSGERGASGWNGLNGYVNINFSDSQHVFGNRSLAITKAKPGYAATVYPVRTNPGSRYTFSAYARLSNGAPVTGRVLGGWFYEGADSADRVDTSHLTDHNRPVMSWHPIGGGWYRGTFSVTASQGIGLYGVMSTDGVPVLSTYYIDGVQLEQGTQATSFTDGSLGAAYGWNGKPFLSTSSRSSTSATLGRTTGESGSLLFEARPFGSSQWNARLLKLGDWDLRIAGGKLLLIGGTRQLAILPWQSDASHTYAFAWSEGTASIYIDGRHIANVSGETPRSRSVLTVGSDGTAPYPGAVIGNLSLWNSTLSYLDVEVLSQEHPLYPGASQVDTSDIKVSTTVDNDGSKIEWSLDGSRWYRWAGPNSFHSWNVGTGDGPKNVWIRFTSPNGNWLTYHRSVELDTSTISLMALEQTPGGITLTFDGPIALNSLLRYTSVVVDGRAVEGTWSYDVDSSVATFTAPNPISSGSSLSVELESGFTDAAGNKLTTQHSYRVQR